MLLINKNLNNKKGAIKVSIGFTLIEALVTVSIFSLIAAFSIPNLSSWYSPIKLRGVQRELISGIRLTQQKAVTTQIDHLIRFSTIDNSYRIIKKDGSEEVLKTVFLPSGISYLNINLTPVALEIKYNAAAVPDSIGEIRLQNNKGEIKKVEVLASGFVKGD